MKISGGKLLIDNEPYEKQIYTPTPRELLYPDRFTQGNSTAISLFRGEDDTRDNSKFIGYAAEVKDLDDVQAAYFLVKKKHAEATHVACAFRIPGNNPATLQDFVDDGEFGAGRIMLKWLHDKNHFNVAVFMVRYYGGKHTGPGRFDIFRQVVGTAVLRLKKATETAEKSKFEDEVQLRTQQETSKEEMWQEENEENEETQQEDTDPNNSVDSD